MAKYDLRIKARELREKGESVKSIANELKVSKSTASVWTRDIILSLEQLEKLRENAITGAEKGRIKSALLQKHRWQSELQAAIDEGEKLIGKVNEKELLLVGLSLYWAEGSKKNRTVEFCNSDPKMIQFILVWLYKCLLAEKKDIVCWVGINISHAYREQIVKEYWSEISGVPLTQFTGTCFKKVLNKKVYPDPEKHFGTFYVKVKKPSRYFKMILGLIEGLYQVTKKEYFYKDNLLPG